MAARLVYAQKKEVRFLHRPPTLARRMKMSRIVALMKMAMFAMRQIPRQLPEPRVISREVVQDSDGDLRRVEFKETRVLTLYF